MKMNVIQDFLSFNQWVYTPKSTQTMVCLNEAFENSKINHKDIDVYPVLIQYPPWTAKSDFFQYIKPKARKQLRKNPNAFFIFDASTEGFSPVADSTPFLTILYKVVKNYGIPANKIFFCSSNMRDQENLETYNRENNIKNSINVFTYLNFERMILGVQGQTEVQMDNTRYHIEDTSTIDAIVRKRLDTTIARTRQLYQDPKTSRCGLSLSRVNRPARVYSTMDIVNSDNRHDFFISHNQIKDRDLNHYLSQVPFNTNPGIKVKQLQQFMAKTPLVVDTTDFKTNHAESLNSGLHDKTLFQIVNETHVDDWGGTSLFYSEKTFRSIYHMQPFVIWGQVDCNKKLADYGYTTYEDWFDMSFDSIKDPARRWTALWSEVRKQIRSIREMRLEDQVLWKFKNERVLTRNFKTLLEGKYSKYVFLQTAEKMSQIANEQTTT